MNKCAFCAREATLLCDFPMGYIEFAGHVPRGLRVYTEDGDEISSDILTRCSRPICDKCALKWHGVDFCPYCIRKMEEIVDMVIERERKRKAQQIEWRRRKSKRL